jgi:hypothetical protein
MAEGDGYIYDNFKEEVMTAAFNLANAQDTIKVALVGSGYSPSLTTHTAWSDASASECAGSNYTAGGETLGSQQVTQETGFGKFDGADVVWTSLGPLTPQPAYCIVYDVTASNKLIAYWEITTATNGGNYTVSWGTDGLVKLT